MKLVDSGESWLGHVPDMWERTRVRNVATLSPRYSSGQPDREEFCTVVPMESVSEFGIVDTSNQLEYMDIASGLTLFEAGDVIFAKITPCMENGKGAYIERLPTRYAFGSTEFHVLRPTHRVMGKFLYYYTFNAVFRAYAAENMTGAAGQKRVSSRFLKDTRLYLPTTAEQDRIVRFLDASCRVVDSISILPIRSPGPNSGIIVQQVSVLSEYRRSLIHECITGKRVVTDEDVSRARKTLEAA